MRTKSNFFVPAMIQRAPSRFAVVRTPLAGRRGCCVRATARLGRAEGRQRRAAGAQEGREQPLLLLLRSTEQDRKESEQRSDQCQADAGVGAVEFLRQDGKLDEPFAFAPGSNRDTLAEKSGGDHRLVDRFRGEEPLFGGRQQFGGTCRASDIFREFTRLKLEFSLPGCQREVDRHLPNSSEVNYSKWVAAQCREVLGCAARILGAERTERLKKSR